MALPMVHVQRILSLCWKRGLCSLWPLEVVASFNSPVYGEEITGVCPQTPTLRHKPTSWNNLTFMALYERWRGQLSSSPALQIHIIFLVSHQLRVFIYLSLGMFARRSKREVFVLSTSRLPLQASRAVGAGRKDPEIGSGVFFEKSTIAVTIRCYIRPKRKTSCQEASRC